MSTSPYRRETTPIRLGGATSVLDKTEVGLAQIDKLTLNEVRVYHPKDVYYVGHPMPTEMRSFGKYYPTPDGPVDPDRVAFVGGQLIALPGDVSFFINLKLIYTPATGHLESEYSFSGEPPAWVDRVDVVLGIKLPYVRRN